MCPPLSFDHPNIEIKQHQQTVTIQTPIYWGATRLPCIRHTELELYIYIYLFLSLSPSSCLFFNPHTSSFLPCTVCRCLLLFEFWPCVICVSIFQHLSFNLCCCCLSLFSFSQCSLILFLYLFCGFLFF